MHERTIGYNLLFCLAGLAVILCLESFSDMDMQVQQFFYDAATHAWMVDADWHSMLKPWLYTGPKILLGLVGVVCALFCIRFLATRRTIHFPSLILLLSLVLVPACIAAGKQISNIYCPYELQAFGGPRTYQHVLEPASSENAGHSRGKSFPAGHASGGFALMGLYFCFTSRRASRIGLGTGLVLGWAMGIYQMARGAHFLSHTLFSMLAAWLIICLIRLATNRLFRHRNRLEASRPHVTTVREQTDRPEWLSDS